MANLKIEERCGASALDEMRAAWQRLRKQAAAPPFQSWEWAVAWQQWFGRGRAPRLLCVCEEGRLVALLPLVEEVRRVAGLPVRIRQWSLLGAGYGGADGLGLLALPEVEAEAATMVATHLLHDGAFDALELDGMAQESSFVRAMTQAFCATSADFHVRLAPRFICPQVDLGGGWGSLLKRSRRAENFKRRLKQLRHRAGFEFRVVTQAAEALAAFERFRVLHEARRQELDGSEATGHDSLRGFHRDLVLRWAEAGLLRFEELWVEGECRASIYGVDDGRRFSFYNSGLDPAWAKLSPGLVLLGLSLEGAARRGVQCYDFLRGDEAYKLDWATGTQETVRLRVVARGLRTVAFGLAEHVPSLLRGAAESFLPAAAAMRLRGWWRRARRERGLSLSRASRAANLESDLA